VNSEVAVVLVIVGDVVHQHGAPDGIGRPRANNMRNLYRLNEVSVGGRCIHPVAIDERIVMFSAVSARSRRIIACIALAPPASEGDNSSG
jgi:hypothetical protein